jgi:hypothetical protein
LAKPAEKNSIPDARHNNAPGKTTGDEAVPLTPLARRGHKKLARQQHTKWFPAKFREDGADVQNPDTLRNPDTPRRLQLMHQGNHEGADPDNQHPRFHAKRADRM